MTPSNQAEDTVEIVTATRRGRVLCVGLVAACVLLIAGFQFFVLPLMNRLLAAPLTTDGIEHIKLGFLGLAILITLSALFMVATGWRILKRGQFPLPDAWVWHDTRVKRGAPAIRIGRLCIGAGILAFVVCTMMLAYAWRAFDRLAPEPLRPGVTIVKESVIIKS